ncbi:hypothetical protein J7E63_22105 [Bacillus sp. ISL-75]|uniref:hypothetical protein n=1 Tax=Bacillus sp. ISL-75 TaxID=2819137 RepID=UPI001BE96971|nr:hypothetical protein [Bacillus sp. ISL-75]MBT2729585.1 hypothetical protein [Bacillus sp. ISL-75]
MLLILKNLVKMYLLIRQVVIKQMETLKIVESLNYQSPIIKQNFSYAKGKIGFFDAKILFRHIFTILIDDPNWAIVFHQSFLRFKGLLFILQRNA